MATVLLVEDETIILNEVGDWLRFEGYDVLKASNGEEGLAMAVQHIPDVIVSDVRMPLMNGRELLMAIRREAALRHIPFIFATASAEKASISESLEMGANAYITKPFEFDELIGTVAKWVGKSV